jgi:hypothetical protein
LTLATFNVGAATDLDSSGMEQLQINQPQSPLMACQKLLKFPVVAITRVHVSPLAPLSVGATTQMDSSVMEQKIKVQPQFR